ncbi:MAG: DNA polymerase III subunit delta [Oscillospiraceae bacterium]|nr:DNA polymerase III subunit delta [Oscillospiraceae bacterium]
MNEETLSKELKQNIIKNLYFLYGKEAYLVDLYTTRILKKCLTEQEYDFNLIKFSGNPELNQLNESVQAVPVFAEKRVVVINDLDIEKLDNAALDDLMKILSSIPETTVIIISITGFETDIKKAKVKKVIAIANTVEFEKMTEAKTADMIMKRVARLGCVISKDNASYIARLCLRNLTLIGNETDKLCAYLNYSGEITRKEIELLITKQLEAGVFALAAEITSRRGTGAMRLLDELISLGNPPVNIMSALSITFIDFYRAKLGINSGRTAAEIVSDFNYPKNRAWAVGKAMGAVSRQSIVQIRQCVIVLCDTDYKLKSSRVDERIIMERAIAELLMLC